MNNLLLLWKQVMRSPFTVGTVAPSSKQLAKALIKAADLCSGQTIVEVGAGTGPLTQWILEELENANFLVLEPNEEMAVHLRERFHNLDVCETPVEDLAGLLSERKLCGVDRILSSVPWSLFSPEDIENSMNAVVSNLKESGRFVTLVYTHARVMPSSRHLESLLKERFENVYHTTSTWLNIPPGQWLVCERPIQNHLQD